MAPKKKADIAAEAELEPGPPDEQEEEGPDTATFAFDVSDAYGLPEDLETRVSVTGLCGEVRSAPLPASSSPTGWEFPRNAFIRTRGQPLYDDLAGRELVVSLVDMTPGANFATIGQTALSLLPLLHDCPTTGGKLELRFTDAYGAKWSGLERPTSRDSAVPPGTATLPQATITVNVTVAQLVGPPEDRESWTTLTLGVKGVFALPPRLTSLGLTGDDDVEAHLLKYKGLLLGEPFGDGVLTKAAETEEPPAPAPSAAADVADAADAAGATDAADSDPDAEKEEEEEEVSEPSEAEWRARQERFGLAVRFKCGGRLTRYRGAGFIEEFRHMLNHTGGVWFYFIPEEKPSTDPKKPNPPEVAPLSSHFAGKAWLDLRSLAFSSVRSVEVCSSLAGSADAAYVLADEPSLASSRSFVRLSLELSRNMAKPDPAESNIALEQLLPKHEKVSKYPSSNDAACIYVECVERCLQHMFRDCSRGAFKESVPGVIEVLKEAGSYNEIRQDLRAAIVHVTRERLRKDTHIVPGKPLEGDVRREFMSDLYTYLTSAMTHVLDDLRKSATPGLGACAGAPGSLTGLSAHGSVAATPDGFRLPDGRGPRRSQSKAHSTPDGGSTPAGKAGPRATLVVPEEPSNASCSPSRARVSALLQSFDELSSPSGRRLAADERMDSRAGAEGTEDSFDPQYPQPVNSIAAVLVESASVRRARESLNAAVHPGMRCERLALEAEMVGNWDRAAQNTQNRLVLEEYSHDPHAWILYAKFCARSRGRQAAAEEALRQAVKLLADPGVPRLPETEREVDFMLACLLLDRERHDEAIRVFRVWHQKDFTDPLCRFLLGLALFLADEEAEAMPLLQSVARPRTWFEGVDSDRAVAEKLRACVDGPEINVASYVACLEKLLDFGLPTLTLTFIDQCGILPPEILRSEPIALMDAKACVMDRDYTGALRTLEKLISRGDASRETFRLAGETYAMVQEFDRALQALMQALNFEPKFTEPVVYVRLGHVFLAKKRWKHARDAFLRSIQFMPTAEAWNGVAYAEYRSEELQTSYEALCEASLLDNEKPELWALLALVHLRFRNFDAADHSLKQCLRFDPDCFDLLLEVSAELSRKGLKPELAECLARSSLHAKDSGPGHAALADALAQQGQAEPAVAESLTAIEMLVDQPDQRRGVFERALKLCEELPDGAALSEAVQDAQRIADLRHAERAQSPV